MISKADYPELANFLACTFHQDWDATADTVRGVVDVDVPPLDAEYARRLATEIAAAIASSVADEELLGWLLLVGCEVIVEGAGYTARTFLAMIGEQLRAHHP